MMRVCYHIVIRYYVSNMRTTRTVKFKNLNREVIIANFRVYSLFYINTQLYSILSIKYK